MGKSCVRCAVIIQHNRIRRGGQSDVDKIKRQMINLRFTQEKRVLLKPVEACFR